ncbi:hypothetical protein MSPP1_004121 [Malassezia sp. CBS 17886]|nr:hypothetical protein MSPP1_004121 [Malassezia sp. CBS 17886]
MLPMSRAATARVLRPAIVRATARHPAAPAAPACVRTLVSTVLLSSEVYEGRPVSELRSLLRQRGLTTAGRKVELIQRLKQADMQRSGSSVGVAAETLPGSARARAKSTSATAPQAADRAAEAGAPRTRTPRRPTGEAAAQLAATETPAAPLEPGTILSAASDRAGIPGTASPSTAAPASKDTPGRPAHKFRPVADTFNVRVPYELPAEPEPQYIPQVRSFSEPLHDYSGSFKPSWHVPRVHAVAASDALSHNAGVSLAQLEGFERPSLGLTGGLFTDVARQLLPREAHRSLSDAVQRAQESTSSAIRGLIADVRKTLPADANVYVSPSNARPSARRPLNEQERRGLLVLAAIVAGGMFLGSAVQHAERPLEPRASSSRLVPHYLHGGGVVGAGLRKV